MKRLGARLVILCLLSVSLLAAGPPPGPTEPLIISVVPVEAQIGQQVLISGVNFGTSPQVTFNGTSAAVVGHRPDQQALVVTVPAGASSGSVIVTNTDTAQASNVAAFTVLPGTYTPTCTVVGTLTDPSPGPVAGAVAVAVDPLTEEFVAIDLSDAVGSYSVALPAAGQYGIAFLPPAGDPLVEDFTLASCGSTIDHQFAPGLSVGGTVRSNDAPNDPIPNASIQIAAVDNSYVTITDATGSFEVFVPPAVYDLVVQGPIGGRHVLFDQTGLSIGGDTSLGDIFLDSGVLLSGSVDWRDGPDSGPLAGKYVILFDLVGTPGGLGTTIADGQFWLPAPVADGYLMVVAGDHPDLIDQVIQRVDLPGDTELDHPLAVYSTGPQLPVDPTIVEVPEFALQEGQPLVVTAINVDGSTVEAQFLDGGGARVDGVDTVVDAQRGIVATRVPAGAVTGPVHVRVDGIDSPGYPVTIDPGVFAPGPFTLSGTVTDGTNPVAGAVVALVILGCPSETIVGYTTTDGAGNYTLQHATGDYFLFVLPTLSSGLVPMGFDASGLSGNQTLDPAVSTGHLIDVHVVDSGFGPVGASGTGIPVSWVSAEATLLEFGDEMLTDGAGQGRLNVPTGEHEFFAAGPFLGRYLVSSAIQTITGDFDFGDVELDSGYFIEGRVVDSSGVAMAGVEVTVFDATSFDEVARTRTVGTAGQFRVALPLGLYHLEFEAPPGLDYFIPQTDPLELWTDTTLYPAVQAQDAGHVQGTVYQADGVTPVAGIPISAYETATGSWIASTGICDDGTYDLRVPAGSYRIKADAIFGSPCLAEAWFDSTAYSCEATSIAVTPPGRTPGIDFSLEPAGGLSGRVVDEFGAGLAFASVCVDEGPGSPPCHISCADTDLGGYYDLAGLAVGNGYRVQFVTGLYPTECWNDHPSCNAYDPVSVNECQTTFGIDSGLGFAAGPVPDGALVPGAPMTARYDSTLDLLTIDWQPTCNAEGHVLYFGQLGNFGTYTEAVCDVGIDGTVEMTAPVGDLFWIIAGTNGTREGSYGLDSVGFERPSDGGALCGLAQDLNATCLPPASP